MKKIVLSSIVLAALFTGCGDSSSCCDSNLVMSETIENKEFIDNSVEPIVELANDRVDTVAPTAVITLTDSEAPLKYYSEHTFSCADSYENDTVGTGAEIVACNWDIQSYKLEDGIEIPYRNCTADVMDDKAVQICSSVIRIVATLTVTDNDGETDTTTTEYTDFTRD